MCLCSYWYVFVRVCEQFIFFSLSCLLLYILYAHGGWKEYWPRMCLHIVSTLMTDSSGIYRQKTHWDSHTKCLPFLFPSVSVLKNRHSNYQHVFKKRKSSCHSVFVTLYFTNYYVICSVTILFGLTAQPQMISSNEGINESINTGYTKQGSYIPLKGLHLPRETMWRRGRVRYTK